MNVVYYSSDFFSEMCGVSIESLCENNVEVEEINIYIVEDNISEHNKHRLLDISNRFHRNIFFIRMPSQDEVYPNVTINLGRTYARMALGEILPDNVERVISLDSDTLVVDSLAEMYNTNFEQDEYVAGVYDCVGKAIQKKVLNVDKEDFDYCNAGMFLIDLKKWRELNVGKLLLNAVFDSEKNGNKMFFLEQDLMNLTFYKHLKLLPPRYNMLTSIYYFDYKDIIHMKKPVVYYSKDEVLQAKRNPAILHATTCFYIKKRMWVENSDHPYYELYLKYRENTLWKTDDKIKDNRKLKKKIYAQLWHMIPKSFAIKIASFTINCIRPIYAKITTRMNISTIANQSST